MKINPTFPIVLLLLVSIIFSGCEKCDKSHSTISPPLTEREKAIAPEQIGDSIFFLDSSGKKYYMVCSKKEIIPDSYFYSANRKPCDDWSVIWEKQTTNYYSNLGEDNGAYINVSTELNQSLNHYDFTRYPKRNNCIIKPGYYFTLVLNEASYYGYTNEEIMPHINNFNFRSNLKLDGKLFQNINYNTVNPNSETNCPAPVKVNSTIDSVYFSTQIGLIRLTTVGGKKYQRIL